MVYNAEAYQNITLHALNMQDYYVSFEKLKEPRKAALEEDEIFGFSSSQLTYPDNLCKKNISIPDDHRMWADGMLDKMLHCLDGASGEGLAARTGSSLVVRHCPKVDLPTSL